MVDDEVDPVLGVANVYDRDVDRPAGALKSERRALRIARELAQSFVRPFSLVGPEPEVPDTRVVRKRYRDLAGCHDVRG